ncbi:hypothetical protein SprV_0501975200 [Sparganum proliferum]
MHDFRLLPNEEEAEIVVRGDNRVSRELPESRFSDSHSINRRSDLPLPYFVLRFCPGKITGHVWRVRMTSSHRDSKPNRRVIVTSIIDNGGDITVIDDSVNKEAVNETLPQEPPGNALPGPEAVNDHSQTPTLSVPTTNADVPNALRTGSSNPSDADQAYAGANPNKEFNKIPPQLRHDEETVAELHCRLDDLRDRLYDLVDSVKAESEAKLRIRLGMEKWMPEKMTLIGNLYTMLIQTELDRFQDRLRLIQDFYASAGCALRGKPDAETSSQVVIDLSQTEYKRLPMLDVLPFEEIRILEEATESEFSSPNRRREPTISINKAELPMRSASNAKFLAGLPRTTRATHKTGQSVDVGSYPLPSDAEGLVDAFQIDIPVIGKGASQEQIMGAIATYGPGPLNAQAIIQAVQASARTKGTSQSTRHTARTEVVSSVATADVLIGNVAPPTDINMKFVFDVTVCALKIVQSMLVAQQTRLCPDPVDEAKGASKKTKRKTSRHTSRTKELLPELSEPSGSSFEDEATRGLHAKLSKEELEAIAKEAEHTAFRLKLIRSMALAVLGDLKTKVTDCKAVVNAWIGLRLLKSHDAINQLVSVMRNTIEDGKMLQGRLLLGGEEFGITGEMIHKTESCLTLDFERVPVNASRPPPAHPGFSLLEIQQLINEFRRRAPAGLIAENKFMTSLTPYLLGRSLPHAEGLPAVSEPVARNDTALAVSLELAKTYRVPQTPIENAGASHIDFVDWRRFMLAVLEDNASQQVDSGSKRSLSQLDLVALAKRFCLLDQARGREGDLDRSSETLLSIQLTRAQFQFACIGWWDTLAVKSEMQNLLFEIFREPELSELQGLLFQEGCELASDSPRSSCGPLKDKHRLPCDDLAICLSAFIATSGVEGLLTAMATLECVPLPPCCIQLFADNMTPDGYEGVTGDMIISYEVVSKLIDFVAQYTPTEDPSTDGSPREDKSDHDLLKSAIFEMLEEKSETVRSSKELSLSQLAEKEEFQLLVSRLAPYFMCPRLPHALTELLRPQSFEEAE